MRLLLLTLLFTSCAGMNGLTDKRQPIRRIQPKKVKVVEIKDFKTRKSECIQLFFKLGMSAQESINSCSFVETR